MKKSKIIISLGLGITFLFILSVSVWALEMHKNDIASALITKKNNLDYEPMIITNYEEYTSFLAKYRLWGKLKPRDFQNNDYIVDFVPYQKNLQILKITINLGEDITLNYVVNEKITNSPKLIVNVIPLEKNLVKDNREIKKEYKEVR